MTKAQLEEVGSTDVLCGQLRGIRSVSEREIAIQITLVYAECGYTGFSPNGFYDDDSEFLDEVADRLRVANNMAYVNKLRRVVRRLVQCGVLYSKMQGTAKEYIDEPAKQMNYYFERAKLSKIVCRNEHTWEPEEEAAWVVRRAYPRPDA